MWELFLMMFVQPLGDLRKAVQLLRIKTLEASAFLQIPYLHSMAIGP